MDINREHLREEPSAFMGDLEAVELLLMPGNVSLETGTLGLPHGEVALSAVEIAFVEAVNGGEIEDPRPELRRARREAIEAQRESRAVETNPWA